jgi:LacI family transcriptional regulator
MPVTIKEVAKKAGVGIGTVSRVFNQSPLVSRETQNKVLDAARELGYYPDASARRLVKGRTNTLAFIERHSLNELFIDAFLAEVIRGSHQVARQAGYHILIEPAAEIDPQKNQLLYLVREKHADGLIISGPRIDDPLIAVFREEGIPVVLQGNLPGSGIPSVDADNTGGAVLAVSHLIDHGHTRIGMITNGPLVFTASQARFEGYRSTLIEAGLEYDRELVKVGNFNPESGMHAMAELLDQKNPPTAVFVASDTVAIGAVQAIRNANLCILVIWRSLASTIFHGLPI